MEVDMMNKVDSKNLKSCWWDSHLNPENSEWLAENSKEMDLNVKQIVKLVEDNSEDVTKSKVIVQVQELYRIYRNLAERYDHLTGELRKTQGPDSGLDQISPMVTPDKPVQQASSFSSVGGSSEKEGTESSSFSSDSDSESFISSVNVYLSSAMDTDKSKMRENRRYEELNEKLTRYEEELRDSNLKLLLAEEEIVKLNTKLKKSESLELELQKQIIELEACFSNSNSEVMRLMEELSTSKENIKASEEEIVMLNAQNLRYENDLLNRGHEVEELKGALCDARDNFSIQKASFQSEIFGLLEKETLLEARLKEWELHGSVLEEKIRQRETTNSEIKSLLVVQETNLQGQINQLKTELNEKVNNLVAEVRSRDLQIRQMEDHLQQLSKEHMQLTKNLEDELKLKIKDLEKEVDKQRNMILDVSEEKREVIRQLTFSLDHYRSGYKELQTFLKHKRQAVIAL
ncbi:hypothetical protein ERO13_D13G008700v2 [Gossypium hirsutum]|uniref:Protein NETWORKED 4B isoform X2 n=3 Tax=Gossypium TaxID=3633 RepID=A0ABM3BFE8_GOSHI|nr:protein NETWORKED 4B-like isoform X2 [Gossypium hirsutum]XP_040965781.1 protein NETWORKED 4B-like isoform X2 [Gossypium hirsutum]KAB1993152.1 hypothetical protein ES319_D13G009700v1 [Gossypium barbadense]KAG4109793.1 hypothetical protein ERO13_D13G008700v2 [Gossypium hirsutum]TYG35781.1 hypothetical protein ES288_D13G010600v1 [Gossypium darwinii]